MSGSGVGGHSWLWWVVVIVIVLYVLNNPAQAAGNIRGWFEAGATFFESLVA